MVRRKWRRSLNSCIVVTNKDSSHKLVFVALKTGSPKGSFILCKCLVYSVLHCTIGQQFMRISAPLPSSTSACRGTALKQAPSTRTLLWKYNTFQLSLTVFGHEVSWTHHSSFVHPFLASHSLWLCCGQLDQTLSSAMLCNRMTGVWPPVSRASSFSSEQGYRPMKWTAICCYKDSFPPPDIRHNKRTN